MGRGEGAAMRWDEAVRAYAAVWCGGFAAALVFIAAAMLEINWITSGLFFLGGLLGIGAWKLWRSA